MNIQMRIISCFFLAVSASSVLATNSIQAGVQDVGRNVITEEGNTLNATINIYADRILSNLDKLMVKASLDPLSLPDMQLKISKKILLITYWGTLDLSKLVVKDFSTIHRYEDAVISYNEGSKKMRIDIPLELKDIKIKCNYWARIMGLGPWGGLDARMNSVRMITSMEIDFSTFKASVVKYEITHTDHISVDFHEIIIIDWLINLMANTVTVVFKGLIVNIIDKVVGGTLQTVVNLVNTVFEDIEKILDGNSTQIATSPIMETVGIYLNATMFNVS